MLLTPGTRIGSYEIVAPLGAGGMGEVYRALDTRLRREVALKLLPVSVSNDTDRLARFEREARTVAALSHPNIVVLHSIEEVGGARFLTMELLEGGTLEQQVVPGGLPVSRVLEVGIAITDALTAAHERGIVHRDLKPANVMMTREGRIKVLDFGLAKMAGPGPGVELSQVLTVTSPSSTGMIVGTVPYMAPEQIRGEAVDARTDLFALGVMLYELAAGKRPFVGETHVDISHAILRDAPKPLVTMRGDLSSELERLVSRCLEKNPRERFQTALDVSNELRRLRKDLERSAPGAAAKVPSERVASIAVLPFVNRSASADNEYFSDGLADELLNMLAKIKGLRVTARTSSFHFKGKDKTIAEIGKALDVVTILEGSVRKAGDRIRVSVQLVNVSDSSHLWSETYDRMLEDIFAVQDDIAQSVVKELRGMLLGEAHSDAGGQAKADVARAARGRGTDPEAHRLFLLARHIFDRATRADTTKAIEYLEQALERDPRFALAWVMLSHAHARMADIGWVSVAEGYEQARSAVERALALEPDMPEGHAALGWIQVSYDWDRPAAETSFKRALELAPRNAFVLSMVSPRGWAPAHVDAGIQICRQAVEQDPLSAPAYHNLGVALHAANRFAEAESSFRRAHELAPQRSRTRAQLALAILAQGRREEALVEVMKVSEGGSRLWAQAIIHHGLADKAASDSALLQLIEKHGDVAAYQVAEVHGARGESDAAFEWLERAHVQRDGGLSQMISPYLRSLHADSRWNAFMKKIGFVY